MGKNERKQISSGIIKDGQSGDTFAGYLSTGTIDRDGEIILPSAFKKSVESFLKNGSILAGHRTQGDSGNSLVIGKPIEAKADDNGLWIRVKYAPTPLAQEYKALIQGGFISGMSVGFLPKQWEVVKNPDGSYGPRVYTDVEILEGSVTPVPCNRDSLISVRGKQFRAELVDEILESFDGDGQKDKPYEGAALKELSGILVKQNDEIKKILSKIPTLDEIETKLYEILGDILPGGVEGGLSEQTNRSEPDDNDTGSEAKELQEAAERLSAIAEKFRR